MENPGPAQSLDEALLAALGDGSKTSLAASARGLAAEGTQRTSGPHQNSEDLASRTAALDALARAGSRNISALVSALRSSDDDVAMYAATALGEARDPSAVPHLIRLVQHPDLNVAQAAIDALGKLRAQSAAGVIETMLEADPWLRFAAAHALGEIGHPGSVHALMRGANDPAIAELAIEALGKIGTVPAATVLADLLAERFVSESFEGCLLALGTALGHLVDHSDLSGSRAWQWFISAEASPVHARLVDLLVRRDVELEGAVDQHFLKEAAIAVIRALALPALYPALIEAAWDVAIGEPLLDAVVFVGPAVQVHVLAGLGHADADVRVFCCTAAAALGLEEAAESCEHLLASGEIRVRVAALKVLAGLGAGQALPLMLRCLADPAEPVRSAAVRALGVMDAKVVTAALLGDRELAHAHASLVLDVMRIAPCTDQRPFVVDSLRDRREEVRRAAVGVLAANENAEVVEMLEPLLHDPSTVVRGEVVQALGRRRSRRALLLLLDQFERDLDTRKEALRAIGRIGDGPAARRLIAFYPGQDHATQLAVIDALGAMAAPCAEPFLARLLCDPQSEIRSRAVVAIGQYATDGAVTRLLCATRDGDARVRLAALESLSAFTGRPAAVESFERLCMDPIPAIATLARRCLHKG
jgi:HEAT repeat protein